MLMELLGERSFMGLQWVIFGALNKGLAGSSRIKRSDVGALVDTWLENNSLEELSAIVVDGLVEAGVWQRSAEESSEGDAGEVLGRKEPAGSVSGPKAIGGQVLEAPD